MIRRLAAAALLAALAIPAVVSPVAQSKPSLDELENKKNALHKELQEAFARIEKLRLRQSILLFTISTLDEEIRGLENEMIVLEDRVVAAATRLYQESNTSALEVLLSAQSFADLQNRAEGLARLSELDAATFEKYGLRESQLAALQKELMVRSEELAAMRIQVNQEQEEVQARFQNASEKYRRLKREIAAAARRAALQQVGKVHINADGMTCPVAALHSFIDSWGFPRSGGRTHEGTDVMADMGAPLVAVIDGQITYSGVGSLSGNYLVLTGDDGHQYMYMHNQKNLVTSGRVKVGEQIATLGDTGNAKGGAPHVHFEYHPNGGGPVNPYPLLMKICSGGT